MNYKLNSAEEDEDAAFRARLAPLVSEMLPRPSAAEACVPPPAQVREKTRMVALIGAGAAIIVMAAAWAYFDNPWPSLQDNAQAAARTDLPGRPPGVTSETSSPSTTLASADAGQKIGIHENARVGVPGSATAPAPEARAPMSPETEDMVVLLLQRADMALDDGDIMGARLLYERAAALGSATAATSVGKTYDVDFLVRAGARGIPADQTSAVAWFRKAAALGDPEARAQLARIENQKLP